MRSGDTFSVERHEIEPLRDQVMANCHRSDAVYAGSFTVCGLLLRLRDFFKWEQGLPPWIEVEPAKVLAWIEARENLWEELAQEEIRPLDWRGCSIDPYEAEKINQDLDPWGLYYGSGLAAFLKPTFFLARVVKKQNLDGFKVIYLGEELARDLFTVPAQARGREILARRRPLAAYLWETILHGGASRRKAMNLVLTSYRLQLTDIEKKPEHWKAGFEALLDSELEALVWHEYGEATDQAFPDKEWRAIIGAHPHSRIELLARTIKDILADTGETGRLNFIIQARRASSLAIFLAQLDGLPERLFPEIGPAFDKFILENKWEVIEKAAQAAWNRASSMAEDLMNMAAQAQDRKEWLAEKVEKVFFKPLGI